MPKCNVHACRNSKSSSTVYQNGTNRPNEVVIHASKTKALMFFQHQTLAVSTLSHEQLNINTCALVHQQQAKIYYKLYSYISKK